MPFPLFFGWEGSPSKIDYRKKQKKTSGTLILTSPLEDLVSVKSQKGIDDWLFHFSRQYKRTLQKQSHGVHVESATHVEGTCQNKPRSISNFGLA